MPSCRRSYAHKGPSNLTVDLGKTEIQILQIKIMESNLEHSYNGVLFNNEKEMSYKVPKRHGRILNAYGLVKENHSKNAITYMTPTILHSRKHYGGCEEISGCQEFGWRGR